MGMVGARRLPSRSVPYDSPSLLPASSVRMASREARRICISPIGTYRGHPVSSHATADTFLTRKTVAKMPVNSGFSAWMEMTPEGGHLISMDGLPTVSWAARSRCVKPPRRLLG